MFFSNKTKKAMDEFLEKEQAVEESKKAMDEFLEKEQAAEPEEWVWVNGYKGTDKDMCCRGYQFELDKQFDMPEDAEIVECHSGFHLCMKLSHVFSHYEIENNNRFFRVRALVRKKDADVYDFSNNSQLDYYATFTTGHSVDVIPKKRKLVAKSIVFEEELTADDILGARYDVQDWSEEDKKMALKDGAKKVCYIRKVRELVKLGFSEAFAGYVIDKDKYTDAVAIASQPDLSMDMKALLIFKN